MGIVAKLADRLTNLAVCLSECNSGLMKMYWKEKDAFKQALYIPTMASRMWFKYDTLLDQLDAPFAKKVSQ